MQKQTDMVVLSDDDSNMSLDDVSIINVKHKEISPVVILDDENLINKHAKAENDSITTLFGEIHKESKLFSEFLEKCFEYENSNGMNRIIQRMLIPTFKKLNTDFKNSENFKQILMRASNKLETDPDHKFSHIANLYQTLKTELAKKRANLITLTTEVTESKSSNNNNLENECGAASNAKIPKLGVIDLVDDDDDTAIIDLDDDHTDVIEIIELEDESVKQNNNTLSDTSNLNNITEKDCLDNVIITNKPVCNREHAFLKPDEVEDHPDPIFLENIKKIRVIQRQIEMFKKEIIKLEEAEVDSDTKTSPYLLCDKYKAKVVELYKELCQIVGENPTKRHRIRLYVRDGYPKGPAQILEEFLNDNVGNNSEPLFPDFRDVVECVIKANKRDNIGWNTSQIMKEAKSLFIQYGRTLQKRRQEREWRDLMSQIKSNECDKDPADEDPELLARLEQNRIIAKQKENEVFERFTLMDKCLIATITSSNNFYKHCTETDSPADSLINENTDTEILDSNNIHFINCNENLTVMESGETNFQDANKCCENNIDQLKDENKISLTNGYGVQPNNINEGIKLEFDQHIANPSNKITIHTVKIMGEKIKMEFEEVSANLNNKLCEDTTETENKKNVFEKDVENLSQVSDDIDTSTIVKEEIEIEDNLVNVSHDFNVDNLVVNINERITEIQENVANPLKKLGDIDKTGSVNKNMKIKSDDHVSNEFCDHTNENNNLTEEHVSKELCDHTADNLNNKEKIEPSEGHSELCDHTFESLNKKVKIELEEDILNLFNEFGDNFTSEIIEIEDPFLVIDISSDSSSEENNGESNDE